MKKFSEKVRENLLEGLDAYSRRPFLQSLGQSRVQYDGSMIGVRIATKNEATSMYIAADVINAKRPDLEDGSFGIVAENQ
jgi:hypothetical protein